MTTQVSTSLLRKVSDFFGQIFDAIVEARRKQAAMETAQYLKTHNRDFRNWSVGELTMHLLDKENPVTLDKKPLKERE